MYAPIHEHMHSESYPVKKRLMTSARKTISTKKRQYTNDSGILSNTNRSGPMKTRIQSKQKMVASQIELNSDKGCTTKL